MANELKTASATGLTLYVVTTNGSGQFWRNLSGAFEAYNASNWALYGAVTLTEKGASGYYIGSFPTGINTAGIYSVAVYRQGGGSPAIGDVLVAGPSDIAWDGAAERAAQAVGVDWSKITNATSTVVLSGTTVGVVTSVTNAVTASVSALTSFLTGATRPFIDYISWLARSDANVNSTAGTEINAAGSGSGTFNNQTKSLQSATDESTLVSDVTTAVAARIIADHGTGVYTDQNGTLGAGAWVATVTVKDTGNNPLAGASVRLTSTLDSGIYTGQYTTDSSGVALVNVIDGSYYLSVTLAGYTYTVITVTTSGNTPLSATMTASAITPATTPGTTTAYLTAYTDDGITPGAIVFNFALIGDDHAKGYSYSHDAKTATSDAVTGLLQVTLKTNSRYSMTRTGGTAVQFSTGSATTYQLPEAV